ncbi:hypothetical protein N665_4126s0001 [Sinapis alba]|nr:hypothetical protein N665_4126s0001 [Sinapis alba]
MSRFVIIVMTMLEMTKKLSQKLSLFRIRLILWKPRPIGRLHVKFGRVPENVEFQIPRQGKRADDPPTGYFTCYDAHIMCYRLWFPILEIIVRTLNRFWLSIGQINLTCLQHLLGILVLGYEHGVPLSVDHFEAVLNPLAVTGGIYCLAPCTHMSIIREIISNGHVWEKCFFFVHVNNALVEESCIPDFRSEWGRYDQPFTSIPRRPDHCEGSSLDRFVLLDFFYSKASSQGFETSPFTISPQVVVEERSYTTMDEFFSRDIPTSRGNEGLSKGKGVELGDLKFSSDDFSLPGWPSNFASGNGSGTSDFSLPDCNFNDLFKDLPAEFDLPTTMDGQARSKTFAEGFRIVNAGLLSFNSALEASYWEVRLCRFKAERAESEVALLREQATARNKDLERKHAKELLRAKRRGKREIAAVVAGRAAQFKTEFRKLRGAQ